MMTGEALRIMVASHSHVNISKGGAEVAAYELYRNLATLPQFEATLLACSRDQLLSRLGSPITQPFTANEYVYSVGEFDWFNFANRDRQFPAALAELLAQTRPQILHFHHYILFGCEVFLHIKRLLPDSVVVLTLHEYLAICNNQGQMIKTERNLLCQRASDLECARCFPHRPPGDFFLRRSYIKRFLDLVDHFISPSQFLASRYIDWGVPAEKMSIIENVPRPRPALPRWPHASFLATKTPLRAGF
jgi:Glycosyltransferase Family 4